METSRAKILKERNRATRALASVVDAEGQVTAAHVAGVWFWGLNEAVSALDSLVELRFLDRWVSNDDRVLYALNTDLRSVEMVREHVVRVLGRWPLPPGGVLVACRHCEGTGLDLSRPVM